MIKFIIIYYSACEVLNELELGHILLEVLPQTVEQKVFTGVRVANRLRTKKKERKNDDLSNFEILKDAKYFTICFPYRYISNLSKGFFQCLLVAYY